MGGVTVAALSIVCTGNGGDVKRVGGNRLQRANMSLLDNSNPLCQASRQQTSFTRGWDRQYRWS